MTSSPSRTKFFSGSVARLLSTSGKKRESDFPDLDLISTSLPARKARQRKPSHLGSKCHPSSVGSSVTSFASIGAKLRGTPSAANLVGLLRTFVSDPTQLEGRRLDGKLSCLVALHRSLGQFAVAPHIVMRHACGGETLVKGGPDATPVELKGPSNGRYRLIFVVNDKPRDAVLDDFRHRSTPEGNDGRTAGQGLDHHQAERLRPVDGKKQSRRVLQEAVFSGVIDLADKFGARGIDQRLQLLPEVTAVTGR